MIVDVVEESLLCKMAPPLSVILPQKILVAQNGDFVVLMLTIVHAKDVWTTGLPIKEVVQYFILASPFKLLKFIIIANIQPLLFCFSNG